MLNLTHDHRVVRRARYHGSLLHWYMSIAIDTIVCIRLYPSWDPMFCEGRCYLKNARVNLNCDHQAAEHNTIQRHISWLMKICVYCNPKEREIYVLEFSQEVKKMGKCIKDGKNNNLQERTRTELWTHSKTTVMIWKWNICGLKIKRTQKCRIYD